MGAIRAYVLARADADLVAEGQLGPATAYGTPEAAHADARVVNRKDPANPRVVVLKLEEVD